MLHRILVPLDGTDFAEAALPYAEALARRTGAKIHLVRASIVRHPPPDNTEESRIVARERAYLVEQAQRLGAGQFAATVTLQQSDPPDAIVGQARQWGADLIVMATHERGPLGRAIFGSTTGKVLDDTPAPVLLVQPGDAAPFAGAQRVLLPLDGSPQAEEALPIAQLLAQAFEAPLTLVLALDRGQSKSEHALRIYLREVAERLAAAGLTVQIEVRSGDAARAIRDVAAATGATVIAMAMREHNVLRRVVLGSTAEAVLRATEIPLVMVRPKEEGREG
ncbi:MAG: universal stress protein [Thermomicrobiales bacterium]